MPLARLVVLPLVLLLVASTAAAAEPLRLRVLSYNIHHAEGVDGKLDLPRIAAVIKGQAPTWSRCKRSTGRLPARPRWISRPNWPA